MFKRIKRLLRKRNNAGFTLVEVIVASALLGVLMLGMFGFVQPVLNTVRAREQNARAVMLCETIESYIANSTKYAYFVQTFSGVTSADVTSNPASALAPITSAKYLSSVNYHLDDPSTATDAEKAAATLTNNVLVASAGTLQDMIYCLKSIVGTTNYEIRCIGMRWLTDPKSGEKKLMLTNEVVNQETCAIDSTKTKMVFEPCFYDGLYPVLKYRNYTNQYQYVDSSTGNVVNKYSDADLKVGPGLEIKMDVYLDAGCYSTTELTRKTSTLSFSGTTYADYRNISSVYTINKASDYKVVPHAIIRDYNQALLLSPGQGYDHPSVGATYYPDTYIYYIVRKTKTGGGTPSPGPTPGPTPTPTT